MAFKTRSKTFCLDPASIDEVSAWFVENQESIGMERADRVRARLVFEEALLNLAQHFGAQQEAIVFFEKRWQRYRLRLLVRGERFNPLKENGNEQDVWSYSLFSIIDLRFQYSYNMATNVLRLPLPRHGVNPVLKIVFAIAVGLIAGLVGNVLVPEGAQEAITDAFLKPISDMWVRILQLISGPVIFFTALNATIGTKRISDYGGSRFSTVARYFALSALAVVIALLFVLMLPLQDVTAISADRRLVATLLDTVLQIVPSNLVEPVSSANTPQLLLIAIITGYAIAAIGDGVAGLRSIVSQVNILGLTIAQQVCACVPYFVGLLLCLRVLTRKSDLLSSVWGPLALSVGLSILVFVVFLLYIAARLRVNPFLLAAKLRRPLLAAVKRGTVDYSSVDALANACRDDLGVDAEFSRAALPQGLVLFTPISAIGILVFVVFAANATQLHVDQAWMLCAMALAVALAVATPPLTGANLLAFVVAFSFLGISNDLILDAMVFDILFSVVCMSLDQCALQLETALQADRLGFLHKDVLNARAE